MYRRLCLEARRGFNEPMECRENTAGGWCNSNQSEQQQHDLQGGVIGVKKPNRLRLGSSQHAQCCYLPSRKALSAGKLGRSPGLRPGLLSAPSQGCCLSGHDRFRSAYSCGAAMVLHHLPWAQHTAMPSPNFRQRMQLLDVSVHDARQAVNEAVKHHAPVLSSLAFSL